MTQPQKTKTKYIFLVLRIVVVAAGIIWAVIWLSSGQRWQNLLQIFKKMNRAKKNHSRLESNLTSEHHVTKKLNYSHMKFKTLLSIALIFIATLTFGQKNDYSKYEGYVDFGNLEKFETSEEVVEVVIEEHLLRMVSKMAGKNEPELSKVLDGIKLIKVHTFGISEENYTELANIVKSVDKKLMQDGWDRIVKTRSKDEVVSVFILTSNEENIDGLVVTTVEKGGEAVFVNIVGDIDLETIGELSDKFDIPSINDLNEHKRDSKYSDKKGHDSDGNK